MEKNNKDRKHPYTIVDRNSRKLQKTPASLTAYADFVLGGVKPKLPKFLILGNFFGFGIKTNIKFAHKPFTKSSGSAFILLSKTLRTEDTFLLPNYSKDFFNYQLLNII